eukprot:598637-Pyramimonas_sp.AAC.1
MRGGGHMRTPPLGPLSEFMGLRATGRRTSVVLAPARPRAADEAWREPQGTARGGNSRGALVEDVRP